MKKIIITSLLVAGSFLMANAQDVPAPGKWAKEQATEFAEIADQQLELTDELEQQVYEARLKFVSHSSYYWKQKKNGELTAEETQEKVNAVQKESNQKIMSLLGIKWKELNKINKAFVTSQKAK